MFKGYFKIIFDMAIQTISTKQLREDFGIVKDAMDDGQKLLLLYRSKPLAEIRPVKSRKSKLRTFSKRQIQQWIEDDKLSDSEQAKIDEIINRLP